jgi:hypothetical protein
VVKLTERDEIIEFLGAEPLIRAVVKMKFLRLPTDGALPRTFSLVSLT